MNDTGTPSKTDIRSKSWRLQSLLGAGFDVFIEWKGPPENHYLIAASKDGQYASWTMVPADFDYTDDQLLDKFINPAKGVFHA